ncbi:MAG: tripartite tricarboxylate transporter substrate binding protein [Betaproteobacteria bacterium]|nr:tripartite tricarboxylate transporter substrate binding protein [Betaproteobacteria bacterium]
MSTCRFYLVPLALLISLAVPLHAAEFYPSKPIRIVVPFSPGGTNDIAGRLLAEKLTAALGQTVFVENRAGASTNIGTEFVVRSAPDGHTLLLGSTSSAANVTLYPRLPFDLRQDFAPVSLVATTSQVLFVHPSVPVRSVQEFIRLAKSRPGELTYASGGIAGPPHLAGALFNSLAGVELVHIPYKGGADAVTSVMSGQTSASFAGTASALPQILVGRLRALGVTTAKRVAAAPEIPTIAEAGVAGYEMSGWMALLAPAATPRDIVARLNRVTVAALAMPDVRQRFMNSGAEAEGSTPPQLESFIGKEIEKYARIIQEAKIRAE